MENVFTLGRKLINKFIKLFAVNNGLKTVMMFEYPMFKNTEF